MVIQNIILVTGASSGFGKITASLLVQQGHIVYGTSRKESNDTTDGIKMLKMDVTDSCSIQQVVNQVIAKQGHIDVLINNAGIGISGALELATEDEIFQQINTNFLGIAKVCSAVLPYMRKERKGKIINISSIAGMIAVPFQGFYSASKFAVEGYSEALAAEVYPFGIRVCLVEPGDFRTSFTANRNISNKTLADNDYKETFVRIMKIIEKEENEGASPKLLGYKICKLISKKNPPFRTLVGPTGQVLFAKLKNWLPNRLTHYIIRKFYQI